MCEENKEIEGKNCSKCGKWKEIEQYRLTIKRKTPPIKVRLFVTL